MRIEFHPELQFELKEIRDFYEARSKDLGKAFVDEFERQILRIASMPERYMMVRNDIRRCLMNRFP